MSGQTLTYMQMLLRKNRSIRVLSVLLLVGVASSREVCAQNFSRSDAQIRFAADRTRPQHVIRRRAGGWEARGPHVAVFSPNSGSEAQRVANQVEATWSDAAILADYWMNTHRQPNFGVGSVNVRILRPGQQMPQANNPRDIFLASSDDGDRDVSAAMRTAKVRRATVRAFFDVAQLDEVLPEWVESGLESYLVGEPSTTLARKTRHADQPSAAWVRALLEAEDGKYAWLLFDAIARANQSSTSPRARASVSATFAVYVDLPKLAQAWIDDPLSGQPVLKAPARLDGKVRPIVADMFDVLKLDRRFAATMPRPVRPKIVSSGLRSADPWAHETPATRWSIGATRDRLQSPAASRWATVDARGQLVTSQNQASLDALFDRAQRQLAPVVVDNRRMLRATLDDGRVVEGWLEENRDNPARPILTIRISQPGSLEKSGRKR